MTITTRTDLLERLEQIRRDGYATDEEESSEGVCRVGAPVAGSASPVAVAPSAPRDRFLAHRDEYIAAALDVMRHVG